MASFRYVPLSSTIKQWCPLEGVSHVAVAFESIEFALKIMMCYSFLKCCQVCLLGGKYILNSMATKASHWRYCLALFLAIGRAPPVWMSVFHNQSRYLSWRFSLV
ncbi:hypothetical protein CsSME_00051670 [Camellia sinensis var. sinensis]